MRKATKCMVYGEENCHFDVTIIIGFQMRFKITWWPSKVRVIRSMYYYTLRQHTINEHFFFFSRFQSITHCFTIVLRILLVCGRESTKKHAFIFTVLSSNYTQYYIVVYVLCTKISYFMDEFVRYSCHEHYEPWLNYKLLYVTMQPIMDLLCLPRKKKSQEKNKIIIIDKHLSSVCERHLPMAM